VSSLTSLNDEVQGLAWPEFMAWFATVWKQGEHLNVAGPTGAGKTTWCTSTLMLRKAVLACDVKGGDDTLAETDWPRISGKKDKFGMWLPYEYRKDLNDGKPVRLIVGKTAKTFADLRATWAMMEQFLEYVFIDGRWTVYFPDLQLLTDPGLGNVKVNLNLMWIAARNRKVSLMTDLQEFAWTPRLARSMPRWFVAGYTRDLDSVEAMARAAGRSNAETKGMIAALKQREFSWLVFSNNPRHPVTVTVPDPSYHPWTA
jgi:hypothetical protein